MSATAASCCSGSRDTPSERPPPPPVRTSLSLDDWAHASHGARGQAVGIGPRGTANHTGLLPARSAPSPSTSTFTSPLPPFFVCFFFFLLETDSIHIEYNIFVYLTGRGGGGDRGGAGPAARYSSPRGHWGRDPRPLSSPLCTVLWIRNTHLVSKEFILRCVCVCVCLLFRPTN